jgi:peptidylprolyl isomerase
MHEAFRLFAALLAVLAVAGCGLKIGDKMMVKIAYTGTLADGTEFDKSDAENPFELMIGTGQVIPGFEENLMGLRKGDKKTFTVVNAYPREEGALIEVPLTNFPPDLKLEVGMELVTTGFTGEQQIVKVAELKEKSAVIDFNSPIAGQDLTFAIEVIDVRKPTKEELLQQETGQALPQ